MAAKLFRPFYGNKKLTIFFEIYAKIRNTRVSGHFNFGQVVRVLIRKGQSYLKKNQNF